MPIQLQVNDGGVWKLVREIHVNDGGTWDEVRRAYVNDGGVWKQFHTFIRLSPQLNGQFNSRSGFCFAGVQLHLNGTEDECVADGGAFTINAGTWLDRGLNSEVWVERNVVVGSWNNIDTTGRNILSGTRQWRVRAGTGPVTVSCTCNWTFYDAATAGNVIHGPTANVTYSATNTFDPCPLCCFTPNTPVTMANGMWLPISEVKKGDKIKVANPDDYRTHDEEVVTGIITRTNRVMYRLHFEDGRNLEASEDHPFHVKGKGAASIDHRGVEYKDLGYPETLKVGDTVSDYDGKYVEIVKIELMEFSGTVYTLENSLFYANGLLVY